MARTSNIFVRVEPSTKEQAEAVLNQLGIPMSNAIGLFLKQVILQRGIPFDVKLPADKPLAFESLSKEQFDEEIKIGLSDLANGRVISAVKVAEDLKRDYGI